MEQSRRKAGRRDSDRVLGKVIEILRVIEKMSKGESVDFTETYADLVGLKDQVGRRKEDRQLGEALCTTIGSIACNLVSPAEESPKTSEEPLRKVRITKMGGARGKMQAVIVGWEESPPQVGKIYRVFQENGSVIRTTPVTRVSPGYVQTRNSLYQLEVVEDRDTNA